MRIYPTASRLAPPPLDPLETIPPSAITIRFIADRAPIFQTYRRNGDSRFGPANALNLPREVLQGPQCDAQWTADYLPHTIRQGISPSRANRRAQRRNHPRPYGRGWFTSTHSHRTEPDPRLLLLPASSSFPPGYAANANRATCVASSRWSSATTIAICTIKVHIMVCMRILARLQLANRRGKAIPMEAICHDCSPLRLLQTSSSLRLSHQRKRGLYRRSF